MIKFIVFIIALISFSSKAADIRLFDLSIFDNRLSSEQLEHLTDFNKIPDGRYPLNIFLNGLYIKKDDIKIEQNRICYSAQLREYLSITTPSPNEQLQCGEFIHESKGYNEIIDLDRKTVRIIINHDLLKPVHQLHPGLAFNINHVENIYFRNSSNNNKTLNGYINPNFNILYDNWILGLNTSVNVYDSKFLTQLNSYRASREYGDSMLTIGKNLDLNGSRLLSSNFGASWEYLPNKINSDKKITINGFVSDYSEIKVMQGSNILHLATVEPGTYKIDNIIPINNEDITIVQKNDAGKEVISIAPLLFYLRESDITHSSFKFDIGSAITSYKGNEPYLGGSATFGNIFGHSDLSSSIVFSPSVISSSNRFSTKIFDGAKLNFSHSLDALVGFKNNEIQDKYLNSYNGSLSYNFNPFGFSIGYLHSEQPKFYTYGINDGINQNYNYNYHYNSIYGGVSFYYGRVSNSISFNNTESSIGVYNSVSLSSDYYNNKFHVSGNVKYSDNDLYGDNLSFGINLSYRYGEHISIRSSYANYSNMNLTASYDNNFNESINYNINSSSILTDVANSHRLGLGLRFNNDQYNASLYGSKSKNNDLINYSGRGTMLFSNESITNVKNIRPNAIANIKLVEVNGNEIDGISRLKIKNGSLNAGFSKSGNAIIPLTAGGYNKLTLQKNTLSAQTIVLQQDSHLYASRGDVHDIQILVQSDTVYSLRFNGNNIQSGMKILDSTGRYISHVDNSKDALIPSYNKSVDYKLYLKEVEVCYIIIDLASLKEIGGIHYAQASCR